VGPAVQDRQLRAGFHGTGVRDQFERTARRQPAPARDYGRGFWRQQWLGLVRLAESVARRPRGTA
jgi:hypothetical protein